MSEPKHHIERLRPPWRTTRLTECGHPIEEFETVLSVDEVIRRLREHGKTRVTYTTCMTCWGAASRWQSSGRPQMPKTFEEDPVGVISRGEYGRYADLLNIEMRALALLYRAHPEEYAQAVEALENTTDIDVIRAQRVIRRARGQ